MDGAVYKTNKKKTKGAMRDRKPVLGIGMRGDLVSKVGEGLT